MAHLLLLVTAESLGSCQKRKPIFRRSNNLISVVLFNWFHWLQSNRAISRCLWGRSTDVGNAYLCYTEQEYLRSVNRQIYFLGNKKKTRKNKKQRRTPDRKIKSSTSFSWETLKNPLEVFKLINWKWFKHRQFYEKRIQQAFLKINQF